MQSDLAKLCQSQSNLVNHLVKLQSWFQDHLIWSNLVDQWGFKWVLAIGQCFKVFSVFMLYQFQVLKLQNKVVKSHMQIHWGHFIGFGVILTRLFKVVKSHMHIFLICVLSNAIFFHMFWHVKKFTCFDCFTCLWRWIILIVGTIMCEMTEIEIDISWNWFELNVRMRFYNHLWCFTSFIWNGIIE